MYLLFKKAKFQVSLWQALHKADKLLVVTYHSYYSPISKILGFSPLLSSVVNASLPDS